MFEALQLSPLGFAWIFAFVALGSLVQGAIGFGLNLVVVPIVAIVEPRALPAAMIIMALPHTLGTAIRESAHIDRAGVFSITLGRIPGVVLGAWIVHVLPPETLAVAIGGFVVAASLMSAVSPPLRVTPMSTAFAGFLGGVMGTASSIGGPPIALVYQNEKGPVMRSTLGAAFAIGIVLSLAALFVAGEIENRHWVLGLALMPAVALGLFASSGLHAWLDKGWLRPTVLAFSFVAGMSVMARGWLA